ncbi:MAG TPA: hypothetical protein DCK93_08670 [Blastocatellia bacterium]|jgi:hypothetical protein|nr:hypothetical protein [Blastocatellia bacterium]
MIALQLRTSVNPVPPKEPPPVFQIVRGRLPLKLPLTAISEPNPIYPFIYALLFGFLFGNFGNARANFHSSIISGRDFEFLKKIGEGRPGRWKLWVERGGMSVHLQYIYKLNSER